MEKISCYILAGGHSSRFGRDKARAQFEDNTLIQHVAHSLNPSSLTITVVADKPNKYADLGLRTIGDSFPGMGPLEGLHTALADFGFSNIDPSQYGDISPGWILVTSCDLLGLQSQWVDRLMLARRPGDLAVAFRGSRWEPFPGLYHSELYDIARRRVFSGKRSLRQFLDRVGAFSIPVPQNWNQAFQINTPQDLEAYVSTRSPCFSGSGRSNDA